MKRTRKQIGSLMLLVCMVFTMLPIAVFVENGGQDSGTPLSTRQSTANFTDTHFLGRSCYKRSSHVSGIFSAIYLLECY